MSWTVFTADFDGGMVPFRVAIEGALVAHPAWEFVDEVTEYYDQEVSGGTYHQQTITIRVYRNLGTLNSLGEDFYIGLITANTFYPLDTDPEVGYTSDYGELLFVAFEDYILAEQKMVRPIGYSWNGDPSGGVTFEPTYKSIRGDQAFHFVQSQISDDGLTWGDFTSWNKPIETVPANLNNNSVSSVLLYGSIYGGYISDDPGSTPPAGAATLRIRVSNDGLFIRAEMQGAWSNQAGHVYVGLGDESKRPEPLQTGFPLVISNYIDMGNQSSGYLHLGRFPEAGDGYSDIPGGKMGEYESSMQALFGATTRADYWYPGLTPYAFTPMAIKAFGEAVTPKSGWGSITADLGIILPGLYNAADRNGGFWQQEDTITGPDGRTYHFFSSDYPGNEDDYSYWYVIDKDLD